MQPSDDYLQQFEAFRQELEVLASCYQRACIDQMIEQLQQEQERFTKSPTRTQRAIFSARRWSSRQLMALAHWIEPRDTDEPRKESMETDAVDSEVQVLQPDPVKQKKQTSRKGTYGRSRKQIVSLLHKRTDDDG